MGNEQNSIVAFINDLVERGICDAIGDGISIEDEEFKILYQNEEHKKIFGSHIGESCYKAYAESARVCDNCPLVGVFKDNGIHRAEWFIPSTNNYYDITASPIRSKAGKTIAGIEVVKDITDRKKAENSLARSESRYHIVVDDMPGMVCRFLPDGTLTFVNKAYCEYYNKTKEELINQNMFQFMPEYEHEKVRNYYISLTRENPVATYEYQDVASDGSLRWQQCIDRALFDEHEQNVEYQSVGRDITEQRNLELEVQRAQKLESVGVLAGGIAHDFNNFLTAIISNLYLIKRYTTPDKKTYERIEAAEKATMKAQTLTQQLLTFSRGGEPIKHIISICDLIRETADFTLRGSNVLCEYSFSDNLWLVNADEGQISQVINNIIINANQAMPEGGSIHINCENYTEGSGKLHNFRAGDYVKISIRDHGIGIMDEHIPKIFDPYFTTKQNGSGLGLATAYSIVKKHDGYICVESVLGKVTVFDVYLPASKKIISIEKIHKGTLVIGEGRILVMDDDLLVRDALGKILENLGYGVEFAKDGKEAMVTYKDAQKTKQPFDVVILDLTIPGGIGGKEVIKKLLAIDPYIKAIVSSGYSNDPVMANFKDYGFRAVLTKPYKNIAELSGVVNDVIKGG